MAFLAPRAMRMPRLAIALPGLFLADAVNKGRGRSHGAIVDMTDKRIALEAGGDSLREPGTAQMRETLGNTGATGGVHMCEHDDDGMRYIERVISRLGVTDHDELERVVDAIVACRSDIDLLEEHHEEVEAGVAGIEMGSIEWRRLRHMLEDDLADDARSCASVLGVSPSEAIRIAWRCHVQDRDEKGKGTSDHVEAMVTSLVERMREDR